MAFDPANPADNEELRRIGTVIRPNWVAIQEGDTSFKPYSINLNNRTELVVADDPTAIADTFIMYSKDASTTTPLLTEAELFGRNEAGDIIQFTMGLPVRGSTGSSFLPGTSAGVTKVAWGGTSYPTGSTPVIIPSMATIHAVFLSPGIRTANTIVSWQVPGGNTFNVVVSGDTNPVGVFYYVIGV